MGDLFPIDLLNISVINDWAEVGSHRGKRDLPITLILRMDPWLFVMRHIPQAPG
jgi:hypothetical protein